MTDILYRWDSLQKQVRIGGQDRKVLDLGPLSIPAGQFVCILGPSGCGKTTLLGILGLVDQEFGAQTDGAPGLIVEVDGAEHRITRGTQGLTQVLRRSFAFIFQDIRLRLEASALQNVIDPLIYLGRGSPKERTDHAGAWLERMGLVRDKAGDDDSTAREQLAAWDRPVASFSGGQQQRTAIARAFAASPRVLCADEPTANLDDRLAESIYADLKTISREQGISVVVVTHDRERARRYADYLIEMTPDFANQEEETAKLHQGIWPYGLVHGPNPDVAEPPASADRARLEPLPEVTFGARVRDMFREARTEFRPIARLFGMARTVPFSRAIPLLLAFGTFVMLSALVFFFFSLRETLNSYQSAMLDELQVVRRVRVSQPHDEANDIVRVDIGALQDAADGAALPLAALVPRFDLRGVVLNEADDAAVARDGMYPRAITMQYDGTIEELMLDGDQPPEGQSRLTISVLAAEPGDPEAYDRGISADVAYETGFAGTARPTLWWKKNEQLWKTMGGLEEMPEQGDVVQIVFRGRHHVEPAEGGAPPLLCVGFALGQHFQFSPEETNLRNLLDQSSYDLYLYEALLPKEAFMRIVEWRADPIGKAGLIPASWLCEGRSHATAPGVAYRKPPRSLEPLAQKIDLYATTPRDVPRLLQTTGDALLAQGVVVSPNADGTHGKPLKSQRKFIETVVGYMEAVDLVTWLLSAVPLAAGSVVLALIIEGLMRRRRSQLLLFLVMGARRRQLHLQSAMITLMLVGPALVVGWLVGGRLPSAVSGALEDRLPPEVLVHVANSAISVSSAAPVIVGAFGFTLLISSVMVVLFANTNPSSVFRGTA